MVTELPQLMRVEYDDNAWFLSEGATQRAHSGEHISLFQMDDSKKVGYFSGLDASVIRDGRVEWHRSKSNAATGSIT